MREKGASSSTSYIVELDWVMYDMTTQPVEWSTYVLMAYILCLNPMKVDIPRVTSILQYVSNIMYVLCTVSAKCS